MKVIVNGNDLSSAVMKVSKAISIRTPNQILEGIKLSVKGDLLTLTATDLEIAIEKTIRADTYEEGETVIYGKIFVEFTKKLEFEDQVELITEEEGILKISYGESSSIFSCMSASDYPIIKKDLKEKAFSILQKDFKDVINKTAFCSSVDESRPILKGCLFEVKGSELCVVALDGFRLAKIKKTLKNSSGDFKIIIPARALSEITRLLDKDEEEITFISEENLFMIEVDDTVFTTRLLEGEFINYNQIIPTEFLTNIKVNRLSLLNALERALIVSRENENNLIKLDIKDNNIAVSSASEKGNVNENVLTNMEGKDISIAFNARYIGDALKATTDEFVKIFFTNAISPAIIKPFSGEDYLYLVLPLRIMQ